MIHSIIGILLLYFLPGYLFARVVFPRQDFLDRLILGVLFSVLINLPIGFQLGLVGMLDYRMLVSVDSVFCAIMLVILAPRMRERNALLWVRGMRNTRVKAGDAVIAVSLAVLCLFIFALVLNVRTSYTGVFQDPHEPGHYLMAEGMGFKYPIHVDEWAHIAQVVQVIDSKSIPINNKLEIKNPYMKIHELYVEYEPYFQTLCAEHFILTGTDPVLGYKFLPPLFAVITALSIFLFVKRVFNPYGGILAVLFFSMLKSNINLLGVWFFIPLTATFFILYLFLYILAGVRRDGVSVYTYLLVPFLPVPLYFSLPTLSGLCVILFVLSAAFVASLNKLSAKAHMITLPFLLVVSAHTYFSITMLMALAYLVHFAPSIRLINLKNLLVCILASAIALLLPSHLTETLSGFLKFEGVWTSTSFGQVTYNIVNLVGPVSLLLAVLGIYCLPKSWSYRPTFVLLLPLLANLILYNLYQATLFLPYQRTVYYFMLLLTPFSGLGLFSLLSRLGDWMAGKGIRSFFPFFAVTIPTALLLFSLNNYFDISKQVGISDTDPLNLVLMYPVDDGGYDAIKFISDRYGKGNVVMADNLISFGIYPVGGNHIVGLQDSHIGGVEKNAYFEFMRLGCGGKLEMLKIYDSRLVLTQYLLSCKNITQVYYDKGYFVWEVKS